MKSYSELGVARFSFLINFTKLITNIYYRTELLTNVPETYIDLYKDYHGWDFFLFHTNENIPTLHTALKIYSKLNGDYKSARYQVFEIATFFNLDFENKMTDSEIDTIVTNKVNFLT